MCLSFLCVVNVEEAQGAVMTRFASVDWLTVTISSWIEARSASVGYDLMFTHRKRHTFIVDIALLSFLSFHLSSDLFNCGCCYIFSTKHTVC